MSFNIARHLKDLREKKGITQETLAKKIQCTKQHVSNVENGKTMPSFVYLNRSAKMLGIDKQMIRDVLRIKYEKKINRGIK